MLVLPLPGVTARLQSFSSPHVTVRETKNYNVVWCGVVWSTVSVGDIIRGRSYLTRVTTLDHHHQADQTTDQSEAFVTSHTSRLLAAPLSVPV